MAGKAVPLQYMYPFVTLAGNQQFNFPQIPVAAYEQVLLNIWRGPYVPAGPAIGVAFQESNDLNTWVSCGGSTWSDPGPGNEGPFAIVLTKAWFRVQVNTGAAVTVTLRADGFLILREKGPRG